jgi:DNA-binding LacI/PurR family transcriptional regulator
VKDRGNTRIRSTARDVANALGVSQSTVSRAFSEDASVKPGTRAAILRMAGSMGYKPNALARGLITSRSKIVGLISGSAGSPFYADALQRFSQHLQQHGHQTLLLQWAAGPRIN